MNSIIIEKQPNNEPHTCIVCGAPLNGKQSKYCSRKCRFKHNSSYPFQKARGEQRKAELIKRFGGKCNICGYDKCTAALEFHHLDATTKTFQLDSRSLSNRAFTICEEEAKKCVLLCANCHRELHHSERSVLKSPALTD